jgi:hypothetical protein
VGVANNCEILNTIVYTQNFFVITKNTVIILQIIRHESIIIHFSSSVGTFCFHMFIYTVLPILYSTWLWQTNYILPSKRYKHGARKFGGGGWREGQPRPKVREDVGVKLHLSCNRNIILSQLNNCFPNRQNMHWVGMQKIFEWKWFKSCKPDNYIKREI